ncbi:hypothetical protein EET67_09760 [Pseudaminobacter arsenicus]|uniref:Uncharacterized protein n=1 Tax=Borborobacter arsenicus TaxID=1851146 RepID=A0A432V6W2_9HYPH|nr:hypothetical protein [Pseudaminobacter arsenicus]RUM97895.1 hypothetical protein EET67_09760 [Pseudaminobacter arsenicus]
MSRVLRTFREMLGLLSRGDFSNHCDKLLTEAIDALEECPADKCKAEITVKITLDYELGRVDIKAEAKSKLPETVKFMKTPFWTIDGMLSVEHPNQIDMFPARSAREPESDEAATAS